MFGLTERLPVLISLVRLLSQFSIEVLAAYMCWTASSSGVEQTFSKVERSHLHRGNGKSDSFRRAVVGLTCDHGSNSQKDQEIISTARALFSSGRSFCAKNKLCGRRVRLDKGAKKTQQVEEKPKTEAAWLRKRKAAVENVVAQTPKRQKTEVQPVRPDGFTPKMVEEAKRQEGAVVKRRIEAFFDGHLLDEEKPKQKEIQKRVADQKARDVARLKEETQLQVLRDMVTDNRDKHFFLKMVQGKDIWMDQATPTERQRLLNLGANTVNTDLEKAKIFLVTSSNPEVRAQWHAALKGGLLMSREILDNGSSPSGFAISFEGAMKMKKMKLHMTPTFQRKQVHLADLLRRTASQSWSQWTFVEATKAETVLCQTSEKHQHRPTSKRRVFQAQAFLDYVSRLSRIPASSGRFT